MAKPKVKKPKPKQWPGLFPDSGTLPDGYLFEYERRRGSR